MKLAAGYSPNIGATIQTSGGVLVERWYDLPVGDENTRSLQNLYDGSEFPSNPDHVLISSNINFGDTGRDRFGQRIRGAVVIPESGLYRFAVAANNNAALFIEGAEVAGVYGYDGFTGLNQFNKFSSQITDAKYYERGRVLWVTIHHVEGYGSDNVALGWQRPGSSGIVVVPTDAFLRYRPTEADFGSELL